jgi:caffeoyl-CoA O-methyltransferase
VKSFGASNEESILKYLDKTFQPEDGVLRSARERAETEGLPKIQVGAMDGLHLEVIARSIGAKKAVEIGTLGGYSGTSIARGLAPGGKLYTFEVEGKHAQVARATFDKAGLGSTVEIILGPAVEKLPEISAKGPFDLVFIDADKENSLAWDLIGDDKFEDPEDERSVKALQRFNEEAARGGRFRATLLPTAAGITFAVKLR